MKTVVSLIGISCFVFGSESFGEDAYQNVRKEAVHWCSLSPLPYPKQIDLPVGMTHLPDGTTVIPCQRGMFYRVDLADPSKPVKEFLDFRETMRGIESFEGGVHGLAFHPEFETNGRMFLSYSQHNPKRTVLSELRVDLAQGYQPLPGTERVIFELEQPLSDHWGGQILFGPEGYLYLGLGDGGLRDDPYRLAQNLWSLHGKILRIDVDKKDGAREYGIPPENPFVGQQLMREEIYASGIRNPWGLAFDKQTGKLWCADVGQDLWEEINCIEKGGNYGWSDRDGPDGLAAHPHALLKDAKTIDPIFAYSRVNQDGICIIGGLIYRGKEIPELKGCYVYGDWGFGLVEAVKFNTDQTAAAERYILYKKPEDIGPFNPTFVGSDPEGEIIVLSQDGAIWRLSSTKVVSQAD